MFFRVSSCGVDLVMVALSLQEPRSDGPGGSDPESVIFGGEWLIGPTCGVLFIIVNRRHSNVLERERLESYYY